MIIKHNYNQLYHFTSRLIHGRGQCFFAKREQMFCITGRLFTKSEQLEWVFGDGPARSGYVMFFQEGIQSGAAQTGYLAGFFNVTSRQRHQLFKILFPRIGKCCFPKRSIFRERSGNESFFALDIFCRPLFVFGQ